MVYSAPKEQSYVGMLGDAREIEEANRIGKQLMWDELAKVPFYHPDLDRTRAHALIRDKPGGTYLARPSTRDPTGSVTVDAVNPSGRIKSTQLKLYRGDMLWYWHPEVPEEPYRYNSLEGFAADYGDRFSKPILRTV